MTSPVPVTTGTLAVRGVRLHYELRGSGPLMAIVGSPMMAAPFTPLAELFAADHTVGSSGGFVGVVMPEEMLQQSFGGGRDRELLAEDRYFFVHGLRGTRRWVPDIEALRTSATCLVVEVGGTSHILVRQGVPRADRAAGHRTRRCSLAATTACWRTQRSSRRACEKSQARTESRPVGSPSSACWHARRLLMPLSPRNNLKGTAVDVSC